MSYCSWNFFCHLEHISHLFVRIVPFMFLYFPVLLAVPVKTVKMLSTFEEWVSNVFFLFLCFSGGCGWEGSLKWSDDGPEGDFSLK